MSSNYTETRPSDSSSAPLPFMSQFGFFAGLLSLFLLLSGCTAKPLKPPASAYQVLGEQNYEFQTVWEASIEAMEVLGFQIKSKSRNGEARTAKIKTDLRVTKSVVFYGTARADQLTLEINPGPKPNQHHLKLAATAWTRKITKNGTQLWKYKGAKKDLASAFEKELKARFLARYQSHNP